MLGQGGTGTYEETASTAPPVFTSSPCLIPFRWFIQRRAVVANGLPLFVSASPTINMSRCPLWWRWNGMGKSCVMAEQPFAVILVQSWDRVTTGL